MKAAVQYVIPIVSLVILHSFSFAQTRNSKTVSADEYIAYSINIAENLKIFDTHKPATAFRISLCADVPNNKKPYQVAHNQETGHVFLILQQITGADTLSQVFGFYPKKGLPTLFFKTIASRIKDNSKREYDVEISRMISAEEFKMIESKILLLSSKKYHINKFNCYDYAVEIFNVIAGDNPLPLTHVRFPFIFGKGGSPCGIYKDFKKLKESNSFWAPYILFAIKTAPVSVARLNKKTE